MKMWFVMSSIDGDAVFDKWTVAREADMRGVSCRVAALRLAKENQDPETDERLIALPVT